MTKVIYMKFKTFELKQEILDILDSIRFTDMTSIQEKVLPVALKGKDIIGRSPTGSGKTHSFLIPIFNNLDLDDKSTQAIIIVPTYLICAVRWIKKAARSVWQKVIFPPRKRKSFWIITACTRMWMRSL